MRRFSTILTLLLLCTIVAQAQIVIGGNVYGGGNAGQIGGSTSVTVKSGDLNKVFGGSRMSNVGGNSYVNIDGANATGYMLINHVYGGNDIAGSIGTGTLPAELTGNKDGVDNTWNSFVHLSSKTTSSNVYYTAEEATAYNTTNGLSEGDADYKTIYHIKTPAVISSDNKKIFIGQLFAGGNGDYYYVKKGDDYCAYASAEAELSGEAPIATSATELSSPEVDKTYLDVQGGTIAFAYGGGNNATVREKVVIHVDNPSEVVNKLKLKPDRTEDADGTDVLKDNDRVVNQMGIRMAQEHFGSPNFQMGRFFGGNNKAEMAIRPTWNLQSGKIRNLYSGGNRGKMTSPEGLLLELNPDVSASLIVDNVYGGCRMADVMPTAEGKYSPTTNLPGYKFPNELSARVLVRGGDVNNVFGGNDVTGTVYGGNAIGIYTSIRGDVYGGGNGAYAYTDNDNMENDESYGDFFYNIGDGTSYDALNAFRPNAEQVSIRLAGKEKMVDGKKVPDFTIIKGAVYVGGNCATLDTKKVNPMVELKMGSYVIADTVFLGNNGARMVEENILKLYADRQYSSLDLTDQSVFANYMEGVAMDLKPSIVFDNEADGDPATYIPNSSYVGSFYCGGNVGSMAIPGKTTYEVTKGLNIFDKFVGGCNNANIAAGTYNAAYEGGVLGSRDERTSYTEGDKIKDSLEINLDNLTMVPLRWDKDKTKLIWNTVKWQTKYSAVEDGTTLTEGEKYYTSDTGTGEFTATGSEEANGSNYYEKVQDFLPVDRNPNDKDIRLLGGNVYGGCYNSGNVNGNVVININEDVVIKDETFGTGASRFGKVASGVDFESQRDDVMGQSLSVYGAGCGKDTEIWGSTTVNLNKGYTFQIFGGGEQGVVGKNTKVLDASGHVISTTYEYDPAYSSTVNLNGSTPIYSSDGTNEDLAETEYIYGGGNEGDVSGNTYVNLGNGRIYDAFGGASNANILGHTEVYIGRQPNGSGGYKDGFPWVRDIVYGGNDFGGTIHGAYEDGYDFESRIRDYGADKDQLHGKPSNDSYNHGVLESSTYVEYLQGRVDTIFGGGYGNYDYSDTETYGTGGSMPKQESSFVNIRPKANEQNHITGIFGGGTGYPGNREGDNAQNRSYILIDIPDASERFKTTEVFGAGSYNGLGMGVDKTKLANGTIGLDKASAVVDLLHGQISTVYGGSYNEGNTRRTVINVPAESTINITDIFGGAYGTHILPPCDVYESHVNYRNTSENARVTGAIFGGNNHERRTLYSHINISSPVWSNKDKGYLAKIYGAGRGIDTWSEYTEVNLEKGAKVYEAYGGGEMGHVLNAESVQMYMQLYMSKPSGQISRQDPKWSKNDYWNLDSDGNKLSLKTGKLHETDEKTIPEMWAADWKDAWKIGDYYTPDATYSNYVGNAETNLTNSKQVRTAEMDDRDYSGYTAAEKTKREKKYNTNVIINEGATVVNYAYGGGYGKADTHLSGDVYGNTYIALLGGTVVKDIYAAGTAGAVNDLFGMGAYNATNNSNGFTASANAYVKGGSCRNVYGGGWLGNVGAHIDPSTLSSTNDITIAPTNDIPGETHVVIGDLAGSSFIDGIPTIQRNAYGGGEGGAVIGSAYLTLNNGYVGYLYNAKGTDNKATSDFDEHYEEKIEDDTKPTPNTLLTDAGCLFGGGYIDNSSVDKTYVNIYGGHVRNSAFGGGEIAAIGRGSINKSTSGGKTTYSLAGLYRPGKTNLKMYGGHVYRNIFGGGRGYDNLGGHGTLNSDGYVFGQTEVSIHGGEIGTAAGVADGDGNVFGGGDIGFVYSALEEKDSKGNTVFYKGVKKGERYKDDHQGYYFKHKWDGVAEEDFVMDGTEHIFTEDCKVLVEPHMKVTTPVIINSHSYKAGEYVSIDDLNTLKDKNTDVDKWDCLDPTGIIIHNAVFAGGNTPVGSQTNNANTASVFGNATASIHDIFHRDMITLGTRHTGGLYGDGNLTLVDGYRELNITNYGTDYYSIAKEIKIEDYHKLPEREADYYELKYTCLKDCKDKDGTQYKAAVLGEGNVVISKASTITADEMQNLFVEEKEIEEDGKKKTIKVSVKDGSTDILVFDDVTKEWVPNTAEGANFWEESGVLPVYAGRLMNSIQRADLCGVWGSRMVMQGAQDRVPEEVDYTNYTINRVREVSLNKKTIGGVDHGNYFGIYNIVNYLGALTSDVDFGDETSGDKRTTDNTDATTYKCDADGKAYETTATYYDWKKAFHSERKRNNGNSHNKVALASGVYLELTTEESTGTGLYEKDWGPITGVIELDLINVSTGIGGGFVYAKNQHGARSASGRKNTTLTNLNKNAVTQWDYNYDTTEAAYDADTKKGQMTFETSGNFVHSTQTIIDDCYNVSNKYMGDDKMPAHFWYIKGSVYVYDQYISAYTGVPNAYSETVDIPLTIAAASHGKMKLLNVMPNRYAYYSSPGVELEDGKKVIINDKTYYKNDPISYWDWYLLSRSEKDLFVEKTYVNCMTCKIDGTEYKAGTYVMTAEEYDAYKTTFPTGKTKHEYTDADDEVIKKADKSDADDDYIFRSSNIVGHDTGYILTYEVNNPSKWDNWFTPRTGDHTAKKTLAEYEAMTPEVKDTYYDGPTYRLNPEKVTGDGTLLGQRSYKVGELISKSVVDIYNTIPSGEIPKPQDADYEQRKPATFEEAYIVTSKITVTEDNAERHYNPGTTVSKTFAKDYSSSTEEAYICTNSIQLTKEDVIYKDSKMRKSVAEGYVTSVESKMGDTYKSKTIEEIKAMPTSGTGAITVAKKKELIEQATLRDQLKNYLVPAYYCTSEGLYGGNYYVKNKNYRGLEAWSSLTDADHDKFIFNYDALDLLIDPNYTNAQSGANSEGHKYKYDGKYTSEEQVKDNTTGNKAGYSIAQSVDYTASYNGDSDMNLGKGNDITLTRYNSTTGKYETVTDSIIKKDDELSREVFEEELANEQRHYAPVVVKNGRETEGGYTVYVVNAAFQVGSTPYAAGETISYETYLSLPSTEQSTYITQLSFTTAEKELVYYYCRDPYTIATGGHPVQSVKGSNNNAYGVGGNVPVGAVISSSNSGNYTGYTNLANQQKNFTIHGISPTETSTLYVSRESDIYDLSKEKIITVIYQYDYDETDGSGNVTPISERHVVNIHLSFKSGVPTVANIDEPEIILPGDFTSMREPAVTPGAYEVLGGGWELFERERDAESHTNGIDYDPMNDPLYWYQDGYYVAYYAKSYAGRTYSNYVPVKVANYHDLAEVMSDENKAHHMYIDNKNVKRYSKIYINDYSSSKKNGLDLFKNLYDLSLLTSTSDGVSDGKVTTAGALKDHALLDSRVKAGQNLQFYLRTDIDHSAPSGSPAWTPIASGSNPCFSGTFHGDGHTISGLKPAEGTTGSLFGKLCGSVYNLGVTGSFTGGGVADSGDGYVESCWVKTTGTPGEGVKAVFGNPTATDGGYHQTVNCYYPESNSGYTAGEAIMKPDLAFYNGELAYDLNNFYLYKRYSDHTALSGSATEYVEYNYWEPGKDTPQTGKYGSNPAYCSSGYIDKDKYGIAYVEDRFDDGDFRYAGGEIPADEDERYWEAEVEDKDGNKKKEDRWSPIWPDDYIFFGQKLTYGYSTDAHQSVPTAVVRDGGRLETGESGNRVFRAPAYFRDSRMGTAYFNPKAYLAIKSADGTKEVYPKMMTAIDFAGHNGANEANGTYGLGAITASSGAAAGTTQFYPPLLDDDGLTGITNCDVTKNLLVYAPATVATEGGYANKATHDVLNAYFVDPAYTDYYDNADGYRIVKAVDEVSTPIYGHLVQSDLTATNDHLLADYEDFNAPISYTFGSDYRMWYQRKPENREYVDHNTGWQDISLPFTAELVTTHQKGEITHFYSGSETSKNDTGKKIGHEYWLRNLTGMTKDGDVVKCDFVYPTATGSTKTVTNTFLWDYYYKGVSHEQKDANADTYQDYYSRNRSYPSYPLLAGATPYILGLPGQTYYEFDLSGSFTAENTAKPVTKLNKQIVTFASNTGITIGVSDQEMEGFTKKIDGNTYAYRPSYMNETFTGTGATAYAMNSTGNAYDKITAEKTVSAFRPYFIVTSTPSESRPVTRSIVFGDSGEGAEMPREQQKSEAPGTLNIYSGEHKIIVASGLKHVATVNIIATSGITMNTFDIKPGETIETRIINGGVYIVQTTDGKFIKKLAVK